MAKLSFQEAEIVVFRLFFANPPIGDIEPHAVSFDWFIVSVHGLVSGVQAQFEVIFGYSFGII